MAMPWGGGMSSWGVGCMGEDVLLPRDGVPEVDCRGSDETLLPEGLPWRCIFPTDEGPRWRDALPAMARWATDLCWASCSTNELPLVISDVLWEISEEETPCWAGVSVSSDLEGPSVWPQIPWLASCSVSPTTSLSTVVSCFDTLEDPSERALPVWSVCCRLQENWYTTWLTFTWRTDSTT